MSIRKSKHNLFDLLSSYHSVKIFSFRCKFNVRDVERLKGALLRKGIEKREREKKRMTTATMTKVKKEKKRQPSYSSSINNNPKTATVAIVTFIENENIDIVVRQLRHTTATQLFFLAKKKIRRLNAYCALTTVCCYNVCDVAGFALQMKRYINK